jgi:hypothetical protein
MNTKAYARYKQEADRIDALTLELGLGYLTDANVDAENMTKEDGSMWKYEDTEEFWTQMFGLMHNSVGMRLAELGLKPRDFGVDY